MVTVSIDRGLPQLLHVQMMSQPSNPFASLNENEATHKLTQKALLDYPFILQLKSKHHDTVPYKYIHLNLRSKSFPDNWTLLRHVTCQQTK